MKPILALCMLWLSIFLFACHQKENKITMGYSPIYGDSADFKNINLLPAQKIDQGGKIYIYENTLYQVETDKGIHVIDISNKSNPQNKAFIKIPGCQEVSAKKDTLFTNNYFDMIAVTIHNNQLQLLKRLPNQFEYPVALSLPPERGYFECPINIPGKIIIGWQKKSLTNPRCFF